MAIATPGVAELVAQMQQNLNAINYHLTRISDTKAHDDEIERLENERQRQAEILNVQWEREMRELEEKRKEIGGPAAEKRRQEYEKMTAKRAQEERDLVAARKREDEAILARRKAEDEERKTLLEKEDDELKVLAQKEEEETNILFAKEAEKKRLEAATRENSLYDGFDVQMIQMEDEMESKVAESQKILAELDKKRKAISIMIDAQMKPIRQPTFRRGSRRYSNTPLATGVAAMPVGKLSLERRPALSKINEQTVKSELVPSEIPKGPPTPPQSDHTLTPMKRTSSYSGSIRSIGSEDAADIRAREEMARINAEIMAEMEAEGRTAAAIKMDNEKRPKSIEQTVLSNSSVRSAKLEDPEDVKAREEMVRINAKIMVAAMTEDQARISPRLKAAKQEPVEALADIRAREETARLNAEIMADVLAAKQAQVVKAPILPSVTPRQYLPTRVDPAELPTVHSSNGVLRFRKGGAYMTVAEAPKVEGQSQLMQTQRSFTPFVHNETKHKHLPTWADQAALPIVYGSHGVLKFGDGGAEMTVIELPREKRLVPQPTEAKLKPFIYSGRKHEHLPTWADQSKLRLVTGAWGMLAFREGGADVLVVGTSERPPAKSDRTPSWSYVTRHELLPTWADQSKLPVLKGSWGMLLFRNGGANMEVIRDSGEEQLRAQTQPVNSISFGHPHNFTRLAAAEEFTSHMPSYTESRMPASPLVESPQETLIKPRISTSPDGLGRATMNHGNKEKASIPDLARKDMPTEVVEVVGEKYDLNHPALRELLYARREGQSNRDPYWSADQSQLLIWTGSHGMLSFSNHGASLEVVVPAREDPYWMANQSQLAVVKGCHGMLSFSVQGASLQVAVLATVNRYWMDQAKLAVVRGIHGKLQFSENGASLRVVKSDPYWVDQATLQIVKGDYGRLTFNEEGASLRVVKSDPYWKDQATLEVLIGDHGRLVFNENGAFLEVVKPDPYWVDQKTLAIVIGEYGRLAFNEDGAFLKVVKPDPYWVDQTTLAVISGTHGRLAFSETGSSLEVVRQDPYWTANQAGLEVLRGSHGVIVFSGSEVSMEVAKLPTLQAAQPRNLYWEVNQAALNIIRGAHGMLHFTDDGVATLVPSIPEKRITRDTLAPKQILGSYWADQAQLATVQGSHGMLFFNGEGAATISHETLPTGILSPIETGDFFPDSGSVDEDDDDYPNNPTDHYQHTEAEDNPRPVHAKRTSFGPGAFSSLLNRIKDNVPLVTNLVGNGSYSSFNDESSPITPTDPNPTSVHLNQPGVDESITQSSWPESIYHHETEFHTQEPHQELKTQASPHPMETEFDPYSYQIPISLSTRQSTRPQSNEFQPATSRIPHTSTSRAIPISQRENDTVISRTRALFEHASQKPTFTRTMKKPNAVKEDESLLGDYEN